jgi:hypothetical protein
MNVFHLLSCVWSMPDAADTPARVKIVRARAEHLPDRLGAVARDWIADRRLAPEDDVAVQLGFGDDPANVEAMARAARGSINPIGLRLRRWLDQRTVAGPVGLRAGILHRDFVAWAQAAGEPAMALAVFARRLRSLGIEARLHPRNRGSEFRLRLLPIGSEGMPE